MPCSGPQAGNFPGFLAGPRFCGLNVQEYDGFALFEAPDDAAAAAVEIADVALGHLRSNRLLRVLSAEEMHAALQQAASAPNIAPKLAG
jgi:hypothetical protein